MNLVTILTVVCPAITISAYLPQIIKSWKTRDMSDFSFWTLLLFIIASILWLTYAFLKKDYAVMATNSILFLFQLSLMYLKLKDKDG